MGEAVSHKAHSGADLASSARSGRCRFYMGWCTREPYYPLSSAVCNATIPTLPVFEMAQSVCSPLRLTLSFVCEVCIVFLSHTVCVTGHLL
jgi:hypothetical protein